MYIDKLDDIDTYLNAIKMKHVDVKSSIHIDSSKGINDKDPKFKIGDIVRISKYKNIFAKGCTPNWFEEVFVIKNIKNTVPWTYVANSLNEEEIVETFYEKECKTQIKNNLELKK